MRREYRLLALALVTASIYALAVAALTSQATVRQATLESTSPLNTYIWGSSSYAHLLARAGYRVYLGGVDDAARLAEGQPVLYIVVGPDKPFTEREALEVRRLVEEGRLNLLVADELGTVNTLLEALNAPTVLGETVASGGLPLAPANCLGESLEVPKASPINPDNAETVCTVAGKPLAALKIYERGSRVLVVGDSSIFANFMVNGLPPYRPTAHLALELTRLAAGKANIIVLDTTHYRYVEAPNPATAAVTLALQALSTTLAAAATIAREAPEPVLAAAVLALALLVAALAKR